MVAVPGLRVGDVLLGTKNLRRWLRAASLEVALGNFLSACASIGVKNVDTKGSLRKIHSPSKQDEYVVVTNRERALIVWGARDNLIIPFVNPVVKDAGPGSEEDEILKREVRISPELFSKWFIKTNRRNVRVQDWSVSARNCWLFAHMNLSDQRFLDWDPPLKLRGQRPPTLNWKHGQVFMSRAALIPPNLGPLGPLVESAVRARRSTRVHPHLQAQRKAGGLGPAEKEIALLESSVSELSAQISQLIGVDSTQYDANEIQGLTYVGEVQADLASYFNSITKLKSWASQEKTANHKSQK